MSLYDDIEVSVPEPRVKDTSYRSNTKEGTPSSTNVGSINLSFLKSQLEAKKAALQHTQRTPSIAAPVIQLGSSEPPAKKSLLNLKPRKALPLPIDSTSTFTIVPKALKEDKVFLFGEIYVEDEYNPTAPTDYASFKPKREAQKIKEKIAREVAERLQKQHEEEEIKRRSGAAIAPPQVLIEQDKASEETPQSSKVTYEVLPQFGKGTSRGLGVAANIMSKMGYRQGSGLGRAGQGMSSALRVERTGRTSGLILSDHVAASETEEYGDDVVEVKPKFTSRMSIDKVENDEPQSITDMLKNSSKIVLLKVSLFVKYWIKLLIQNMVTTTDVDSELESEVRGEMQKYGQVNNVIVYSVPNVPDEESVRIFLEFTNVAQAIKALIDLNDRYFGGRQIKASFYSLDDYNDRRLDK
ncbi:g-patch domain-containing protein [Ditylenchus destructor]|uniref:Splicing factor 45 n=1 Tax=Ditylenchus destructor TaxID=166010 RepID=A0AAD4N3K8_9BILA|nr:g-patch domain-containing protein [Ditylenchus destructor]